MDRREEEQNFPVTLLASSASLFSAGARVSGEDKVLEADL